MAVPLPSVKYRGLLEGIPEGLPKVSVILVFDNESEALTTEKANEVT
jgi:hypothetical protein